jgi:excisionase family DNA binding protein
MDALLEQFDERMRRIAEEVVRDSARASGIAPASPSELLDEKTRSTISEHVLISNKTYLTRAEAAKYLGVSERAVKEWSARAADQNPFPEVRAGADPRYKRAAIDEWAEVEGRRQRLKLVS